MCLASESTSVSGWGCDLRGRPGRFLGIEVSPWTLKGRWSASCDPPNRASTRAVEGVAVASMGLGGSPNFEDAFDEVAEEVEVVGGAFEDAVRADEATRVAPASARR